MNRLLSIIQKSISTYARSSRADNLLPIATALFGNDRFSQFDESRQTETNKNICRHLPLSRFQYSLAT